MSVHDDANIDLVTLPSAHGVTDTVARLKALLVTKSIQLFAEIDHAAAALAVGMSLRPTCLLIFGNPKGGTPLMQVQQRIGLDLPLRVLVWEDENGKTWLTYHQLEYLAQRHQIAISDAVRSLAAGLTALAHGAASP